MATNFDKIDCHQVKTLFYETYCQGKVSALEHSSAKSSVLKPHRRQAIIKYAFPALEVHGETSSLDKISLDIRTYICGNGFCILHHNRSHRERSQWQKYRGWSCGIKFYPSAYLFFTRITLDIIFLVHD